MYSLVSYGGMIRDTARTDAYRDALRQVVRPGACVLDIGAGTGIFSLLACISGARKVYAVEPDESASLIEETAKVNGLGGRIEVIRAASTEIELPEPADVIVSDIRGMLPLHAGSTHALADARARLLAPSGTMIPLRDTLIAAPVESPGDWAACREPWLASPYGLDLSPAHRLVSNQLHAGRYGASALIAPGRAWWTVDYMANPGAPARGEVEWQIERPALCHGMGLWFEAELAEGIGYSTGPDQRNMVYGRGFLPWSSPQILSAGERVRVSLATDPVGDDYVWRWRSEVLTGDGRARVTLAQSTLAGRPLSLSDLERRAMDHKPGLSPKGRMIAAALALMDGKTAIEDIGARLHEGFPDHLTSPEAGADFAAETSARFGSGTTPRFREPERPRRDV